MSMAHQLTPYLKQLRLSGILDTLEVRNQQAITEQWSYLEFLTRLIQDEVERRGQKQLDLRVRRSGINTIKTLESFDFGFNPTINRQQIFDLATCEFIRARRNALICGQTGVGKSHLAQSVAHEAARKGFDVVFTSAHAMLTHINAGRADGTYERRLAGYLKPQLLVIDDFGLKPLPLPAGPADLFDVIDGRYEKASIVLTSNRSPSEWHDLFGDPLLASAGLDRLAHRASVILITGQSYRLATHGEAPEGALFGPASPSAATGSGTS
jgi:DNA replication protein DnaC